MAITSAMCTSFRQELMTKGHDFTASTGDAFKMGLFKATVTGTYGKATTNYSDVTGNSDEASGTGYTAGGAAMTNVSPTNASDVAYADFSNDVVWDATGGSLEGDGVFLHNTSLSNAMVAVWDFGGTETATNGTFTVQMPAAGATTAILRLA